MLSGFDIPDEMFANLMQIVVKKKFSIGNNSIAFRDHTNRKIFKNLQDTFGTQELIKKNVSSLGLDIDFLKRLAYFSKNL